MAKKKESGLDPEEMRKDLRELGITGRRAQRMISNVTRVERETDKELIGLEQEVRRFFSRVRTARA